MITLKKIFTFLKESNILVDIKTALIPVLEKRVDEIKPIIIMYLRNKTAELKEHIIDYIMENIDLPWYLKLFKKGVKKHINKNFNKILDFTIQSIGIL